MRVTWIHRMKHNPFQSIYDKCNEGGSREKFVGLPSFPHLIDIEMTNTCNFRCLMCPTGNFSQQRKKGFMSDTIFYKILNEVEKYGTPLRFIRWGEPLSHPSILTYLADAKRKGILLHLNTNGSLLTEEMIDLFIGLPLDSIKFSFQGVDKKSYAEMRNIDFFDELMTTIEGLYSKRGNNPYPFIMASTTTTYETDPTIEAFKEKIREFVDDVNVGSTNFDYLDLNAVRMRPHELEMLEKLMDLESVEKVHPECPEVFDKLSINWDGKVTACCWDSEDTMLIGDINEQSLLEIWQSPKLNEYREMLVEMRHDEMPLCKDCYDTHSLLKPAQQ
jgi:radical SAM protein with 4Fe4S-binding SPASM domain